MHPEHFRGNKGPLDAQGRLESPCVRNCCLDADDICAGCFRTLAEICGWHDADDETRRAILGRCEERRDARQRKHPPDPL